MNPIKRAYAELHVAVLLFGLTAILGDLISLTGLVLVWWRVFLTSISLLFLVNLPKLLRSIPRKLLLQYMGIGVIVALHWVAFYGSIKLANASICLVCMATTSFFTSILEPTILGGRIKPYELALGLFIVPGMALIVSSTELSMKMGIWVGLLSALLASIFAILNKKLVNEAEPMGITLIELGSGWLFLSCVLPVFFMMEDQIEFWPQKMDWAYLTFLVLACTTLAYTLALRSLKHLSAFASNLTVNLEPVYGIFLAWIFLNDSQELNAQFYLGVLIILMAVFSYPFLKSKFEK